jgi:hypothetical protein
MLSSTTFYVFQTDGFTKFRHQNSVLVHWISRPRNMSNQSKIPSFIALTILDEPITFTMGNILNCSFGNLKYLTFLNICFSCSSLIIREPVTQHQLYSLPSFDPSIREPLYHLRIVNGRSNCSTCSTGQTSCESAEEGDIRQLDERKLSAVRELI